MPNLRKRAADNLPTAVKMYLLSTWNFDDPIKEVWVDRLTGKAVKSGNRSQLDVRNLFASYDLASAEYRKRLVGTIESRRHNLACAEDDLRKFDDAEKRRGK